MIILEFIFLETLLYFGYIRYDDCRKQCTNINGRVPDLEYFIRNGFHQIRKMENNFFKYGKLCQLISGNGHSYLRSLVNAK